MYKLFSFLLCVILNINSFSQVYQTHYELKEVHSSTESYDYQASDYVSLKPGFHYNPNTGQVFHAWINKSGTPQVNYEDLYTDNSFDNRQINKNAPVKLLTGAQGISASGGLTYTIPIALPAGTNGLQPNLAISYNSQGGNGLCGMGWNLVGLSSIRRVGKSIYSNNKNEAVKFNNTDNFVLDGNLLKLMSGSSGANNAVYATEIENYATITAKGNQGNGPSWFEVKTKEGLTMEFGNSNDSKTIGLEQTALAWRIKKVYDTWGNYMEYNYNNENANEPLLITINYTGNVNAGLSPQNTITFDYAKREDVSEGYISGFLETNTHLISKISVTNQGNHLVSYRLKYGFNFKSFLNEVQEIAADGKEINPVIFKYGVEDNYQLEFVDGTDIKVSDLKDGTENCYRQWSYYPGDFNGDGLTDFFGLKYEWEWCDNSEHTKARYKKWGIFINNHQNGNSGFIFHDMGTLPNYLWFEGNWQNYYSSNYFPLENNEFMIGDLNGDAKDDIIIKQIGRPHAPPYNDVDYHYYHALLSLSGVGYTGHSQSSDVMELPDFEEYNNQNRSAVTLGDFDGDGILELLGMSLRHNDITIKSFDGRINNNVPGGINETKITGGALWTMDVDGNGDSEVIYQYTRNGQMIEGRIKPYITNNVFHSFDDEYNWNPSSNIYNNQQKKFGADFNGDGIDDFVKVSSGGSASIYTNKGKLPNSNSYLGIAASEPNNLSLSVVNQFTKFGDVNGDGLTDIVIIHGQNITINLSKGNGSTFESYLVYTNPQVNLFNYGILHLVDLDGDGNLELMAKSNESSTIYVIKLNPKFSAKEKLLLAVKDGFNNETSFDYATATEQYNYNITKQFTYPASCFKGALPLIKTIKQTNLFGDIITTEYEFENGLIHKQGKGFLGFEKQTVKNAFTDISVHNTSSLNNQYYVLQPVTNITKNYDETKTKAHQSFLYSYHNKPNGRYSIQLDKLTDYATYLRPGDINTYYSYDSYGNVLNTITIYDDGSFKETAINQYLITTGDVPTSPETITTRNRVKYEAPFATSVTNSYTVANKKITQLATTSNNVTTTLSNYNALGIPLTITTTSPGLPTTQETREVYATGLLKSVQTNQNNLTLFEYDNFGNLVKTTDAMGLITKHAYDGLNRLVKTTYPDKTETHNTIAWDMNQAGGANSLYYQLTTSDGSPYAKTYYNKFGKTIRNETLRFGNEVVFADVIYNNLGLVHKKSQPYTSSTSNIKWQEYVYDDENRLANAISPNGVTISNTYDPLNQEKTTTNTSTGQSITSKFTDMGLVSNITENGQETINYQYHSSGQPKVVTALGATTTMSYNSQGEQTLLDDPNMSPVSYAYNAYGQLENQTDGEGNSYTMVYDELGRLETKTNDADASDVTTYTYYDSGNGLGQTASVTYGNGSSISYDSHDAFGRLLQQTETADDGTAFVTTYTYYDDGKLKTHTYPGGYTLQYVYDHLGYTTEILGGKDITNLQTIWTMGTVNENGQISTYGYGNGLNLANKFDDYGFPERFHTLSSNVFDMSFDFDHTTGNLSSRTQVVNGISQTESFTYDLYDRLDDVSHAGSVMLDMKYFNNGNIKEKSDVGEYSYGNLPHVVDVINPVNAQTLPISIQQLSYTPFDKTDAIQEGSYLLDFTYGPDAFRTRAELQQLGGNGQYQTEKTTYYASGYEETQKANGSIQKRHYINTPTGLAAIYTEDESGNGTLQYIHQDYQGSIMAISDESGTIEQSLSYDAWGRRRNPTNWSDYELTGNNIPLFDRGYTGHEHLDEFGLINMNGRMYDPMLGQMLSPDNFVQNATNGQNYNRYAYVLNNPLKYTDPSGEIIWFAPVIIGAIIGGYIGGSIASGNGGIKNANFNPFGGNQGNWKGTDWWKGAIVGGIIGATAGYGLASSVGASGLSTTSANIVGQAAFAGSTNMITEIENGWDNAWREGTAGVIFGSVFGGGEAIGLSNITSGLIAGTSEGLLNGYIITRQQELKGKEANNRIIGTTVAGIVKGLSVGYLYNKQPLGDNGSQLNVDFQKGNDAFGQLVKDADFMILPTPSNNLGVSLIVFKGVEFITNKFFNN